MIRRGEERGSASVEAVVLAVVVVLPIFGILAGLANVQRASLAAHAAAREAVRTFVTAPDAATASSSSELAARRVLADAGFAEGDVRVDGALVPDGRVAAEVTVTVALGAAFGGPRLAVRGRSNGRVDPYRSV